MHYKFDKTIHYTNFKPYKAAVMKDKRSSKLIFEPDGRYHYVYRISCKETGQHYYGCRTSVVPPVEDLGVVYFSSSLNEDFKTDVTSNPQKHTFKVVVTFDNPGDKILFEAFVHQYFDVKKHKQFINGVNATPFGFNRSGVKASEETRKILSDMKKGENNYMFGKTPSEESRRKKSESMKGKYSGEKHPLAKIIHIYDNEDNIRFVCKGSFEETCEANGLPFGVLQKSYKNDGNPIYMSTSKIAVSRLKNNGNIKYKGWYAKIVEA